MTDNFEEQMKEFRVDVFRDWIHSQIDSWLCEYEAWDSLIEDGDIDEEDWEWIRDNLKVVDIVIEGKQ